MPVIWVPVDQGTNQLYTGGTVPSMYLGNSITQTGTTNLIYTNIPITAPTFSVTCPIGTTCFPIYITDNWEDNVTPTQYYDLARYRIYICRERTEAENRRLAEEQRQREARARIAAEQYRLAGERARELLIAHLTAEQRKTMEQRGWFIIKGGKSGTQYRIRTGSYAGNIEILRGNKVAGVLCCHCDGIPLHDHHLAQKLTLEYDEDRFLRLANHRAV